MELTKEIKETKDKYGHPLDFTYCRNCNTFIDFAKQGNRLRHSMSELQNRQVFEVMIKISITPQYKFLLIL